MQSNRGAAETTSQQVQEAAQYNNCLKVANKAKGCATKTKV